MLTQIQVRSRLKAIERMRDDDEAAHSNVDALHRDVLRAIADGHPDAKKLAALALKTQGIDFSRWCA
jgi:hypothetical protein